MFGLERNKDPLITEEERNTATFVLLKDREFGRSGNVSLFYNAETDQLRELDYREGQDEENTEQVTARAVEPEPETDSDVPWN
jgi:hypothetical protein